MPDIDMRRGAVVHRRQGLAYDRIEDRPPDALLHTGRPRRSSASRPTKMLPNSHGILPLLNSDRSGTRGMPRHCLIHPVTPLLSLFAPLFRPFFSPVRGMPDAAILRLKPLRSLGFCAAFWHRAGRKGVFSPVIGVKQGSALRRREAMGIPDCEKSRLRTPKK